MTRLNFKIGDLKVVTYARHLFSLIFLINKLDVCFAI